MNTRAEAHPADFARLKPVLLAAGVAPHQLPPPGARALRPARCLAAYLARRRQIEQQQEEAAAERGLGASAGGDRELPRCGAS
jgi:hypothetical protein